MRRPLGRPRRTSTCPDSRLETAWLNGLTIEPFRSLANGGEGRAYAEKHGLEFPFSNDTYDAPAVPGTSCRLGDDGRAPGSIVVGYQEPSKVPRRRVAELAAAAQQRRFPVAVWRDGTSRQVSSPTAVALGSARLGDRPHLDDRARPVSTSAASTSAASRRR